MSLSSDYIRERSRYGGDDAPLPFAMSFASDADANDADADSKRSSFAVAMESELNAFPPTDRWRESMLDYARVRKHIQKIVYFEKHSTADATAMARAHDAFWSAIDYELNKIDAFVDAVAIACETALNELRIDNASALIANDSAARSINADTTQTIPPMDDDIPPLSAPCSARSSITTLSPMLSSALCAAFKDAINGAGADDHAAHVVRSFLCVMTRVDFLKRFVIINAVSLWKVCKKYSAHTALQSPQHSANLSGLIAHYPTKYVFVVTALSARTTAVARSLADDGHAFTVDDGICSVCSCRLDGASVALQCGHRFDFACLMRSTTFTGVLCPQCRIKLDVSHVQTDTLSALMQQVKLETPKLGAQRHPTNTGRRIALATNVSSLKEIPTMAITAQQPYRLSHNGHGAAPSAIAMSSSPLLKAKSGSIMATAVTGRAGAAPMNSTAPTPTTSSGYFVFRSNYANKGGHGSSCHQCKTTKDPAILLFCTNRAEKGKRKRRCRKKFCSSCLSRTYPSDIMEHNGVSWQCPSCLGLCICAACTRKSSQNDAISSQSAHSTDTSQSRSLTSDGHQSGSDNEEEADDDDGVSRSTSQRGRGSLNVASTLSPLSSLPSSPADDSPHVSAIRSGWNHLNAFDYGRTQSLPSSRQLPTITRSHNVAGHPPANSRYMPVSLSAAVYDAPPPAQPEWTTREHSAPSSFYTHENMQNANANTFAPQYQYADAIPTTDAYGAAYSNFSSPAHRLTINPLSLPHTAHSSPRNAFGDDRLMELAASATHSPHNSDVLSFLSPRHDTTMATTTTHSRIHSFDADWNMNRTFRHSRATSLSDMNAFAAPHITPTHVHSSQTLQHDYTHHYSA